MRLLLINTCGAEGVVALAEGVLVVAEELLPGRSSSENLVPAIRRLMAKQSWMPRDLEAIGLANGPGSFTGVRVGLSVAKGLCEALGIGMVAMSRLALIATAVPGEKMVAAVLDAGRGEFFCGVYWQGERTSEELLGADEIDERLHGAAAVTCETRVVDRMGGDIALVPEPGAEAMLAMATARIASGDWTDIATSDANYLRRTDAEILVEGR
jgi:tRNA threonylcarbamoyladenosine biosynthesis protein TsaB